jgi:hypothetical protein
MIKFIQDRRPHHGFTDIYVNPSDVMSISDICGERSSDDRSCITLRNGDAYNVTEYASVVAGMINSALEKLPVHQPDTK